MPSHLVSVWIGAHGVLGSQSDAARHDHEEDGHLKVAHRDHVVADPPDADVDKPRGGEFILQVDERGLRNKRKFGNFFLS